MEALSLISLVTSLENRAKVVGYCFTVCTRSYLKVFTSSVATCFYGSRLRRRKSEFGHNLSQVQPSTDQNHAIIAPTRIYNSLTNIKTSHPNCGHPSSIDSCTHAAQQPGPTAPLPSPPTRYDSIPGSIAIWFFFPGMEEHSASDRYICDGGRGGQARPIGPSARVVGGGGRLPPITSAVFLFLCVHALALVYVVCPLHDTKAWPPHLPLDPTADFLVIAGGNLLRTCSNCVFGIVYTKTAR